jgi:hypothetical protein
MRYSRKMDPLPVVLAIYTHRQSTPPAILPQYGQLVHLQVGDTN